MQQLESSIVSKADVMMGQPTIAGTQVTAAQILEKLGNNWFIQDILNEYKLNRESDILAAVEYAESLPSEHPLAQLLQQYRAFLKQKVWKILAELKGSL